MSKPTRVRDHLDNKLENFDSLFWNPATGQLVPQQPAPERPESEKPNPDLLPTTPISQTGFFAR